MAALVDLHFAEPVAAKKFRCSTCPAVVRTQRKCDEDGFDVAGKTKGWRVDARGPYFRFCPGKATWFPEVLSLFDACRVALEAGILPVQGAMEDQPAEFVDAFPTFVDRWRQRRYDLVWGDVREYVKAVLEAVLGKKKG